MSMSIYIDMIIVYVPISLRGHFTFFYIACISFQQQEKILECHDTRVSD